MVGVLDFLVSFGRCESSLLICAISLAGFAMSPTTKQIRLASWSVKTTDAREGTSKMGETLVFKRNQSLNEAYPP